jgi:hypothetical protein
MSRTHLGEEAKQSEAVARSRRGIAGTGLRRKNEIVKGGRHLRLAERSEVLCPTFAEAIYSPKNLPACVSECMVQRALADKCQDYVFDIRYADVDCHCHNGHTTARPTIAHVKPPSNIQAPKSALRRASRLDTALSPETPERPPSCSTNSTIALESSSPPFAPSVVVKMLVVFMS